VPDFVAHLDGIRITDAFAKKSEGQDARHRQQSLTQKHLAGVGIQHYPLALVGYECEI